MVLQHCKREKWPSQIAISNHKLELKNNSSNNLNWHVINMQKDLIAFNVE